MRPIPRTQGSFPGPEGNTCEVTVCKARKEVTQVVRKEKVSFEGEREEEDRKCGIYLVIASFPGHT